MGGLLDGQQIRTAGVSGVIVLACDHLRLANQPKEEIDAGGRPRLYLPAPALYGPLDSLTDRSGAQAPGPRGSVATGINGHSTFTYRARAWRDRQRRRLWRQPVLRRPLVCPDLSSHLVICLLRGAL